MVVEEEEEAEAVVCTVVPEPANKPLQPCRWVDHPWELHRLNHEANREIPTAWAYKEARLVLRLEQQHHRDSVDQSKHWHRA